MPNAKDIDWFKQHFHEKINAAVQNTPFSLDMIVAIACQETGYIWQTLRDPKHNLTLDEILELCVGDTLDESGGRSAFPKTKDLLVAKPNGQQMFGIARQALTDMAKYIGGYQSVAARPNKFCHGFGVFQYDLQFFLKDPDYFLQKKYTDFDASLGKCIGELRSAMQRIGWGHKTVLSDYEMAGAAIAYNTGRYTPSKGLKQGHFDGKKYYGENFFDYLRLSQSVPTNNRQPAPAPILGNAPLPPPSPVTATGQLYETDVKHSPLRLRSEPKIDSKNLNVIAKLPDGHIVQAVTDKKVGGFLEVETSLWGARLRGFAHSDYLKKVKPGIDAVPVLTPAAAPTGSIVAVYMQRKPGTKTLRTEFAGAHSLYEGKDDEEVKRLHPARKGTTPDELRVELAAIIDWLAVDKTTHRRYQPRNLSTFCNIYAHDYCHLAGVYLPRVWWTPGAIEALALGQTIEPLYGKYIEEMRANGLFRWLRDFGLRFGWRQTGTLTKLQTEVNQGAVGLIVARRKEEGRSGHIVAVVPETETHRARRSAAGDVIAPLQSQAGAVNFSYGTSSLNWWKSNKFAESAFWLHS